MMPISACANSEGGVTEGGLVAIVVAVDLEGHHSGDLRRRIGSRPHCAEVEAFASEDAQNVSLGQCAIDSFHSAEVIFVDGGFGAGIVLCDPGFHHPDQLRGLLGRITVCGTGVIRVRGIVWLG
jgi:hypothetical protein